MQEWGGEEGPPDRTTAAELVLRGDGGERRRGVSEDVRGDLAEPETGKEERRLQGGWVQSFWQAPHSHQRF